MARHRKNTKNPVITHGLTAHLEKWKHDGRLKYVKAMKAAKEGLAPAIPQGVSAPAALLIDRIIYKSLKLSIYEGGGPQRGGHVTDSAAAIPNHGRELAVETSNRTALALKQTPDKGVPSLAEYLESLKKPVKRRRGKNETSFGFQGARALPLRAV